MGSNNRLLGWRDIPIGGLITTPGNSVDYLTGPWRGGGERPVIDLSICVQCLHCWISCPDNAILLENGQVVGFDYDHCKGCGICANECPPLVKAIFMIDERRFEEVAV